LTQISQELSETLQELRGLARGIHPALLTERGLSPALEALGSRAPLPVELLSTPGGRLPQPIEATAYYIVVESLTNVAKYAHASAATVAVTRANGRLLVKVQDDGVGGADITQGSGLPGLADPAEALRGTLRIESTAGRGTVVSAELPLGVAQS
jgi:signal transduction histidine kinase